MLAGTASDHSFFHLVEAAMAKAEVVEVVEVEGGNGDRPNTPTTTDT